MNTERKEHLLSQCNDLLARITTYEDLQSYREFHQAFIDEYEQQIHCSECSHPYCTNKTKWIIYLSLTN